MGEEPFDGAGAGKPLVAVTAVDTAPPDGPPRRLGFLAGQISVPEDFDHMGGQVIEHMVDGLP